MEITPKDRLQIVYDNYNTRADIAQKVLDLLKDYKSDWSKRLETYMNKNGLQCYYTNSEYKQISFIYTEKEVGTNYGEFGKNELVIRDTRAYLRITLSDWSATDHTREEVENELKGIANYRAPEIKNDLDNYDEVVADIEDAKRIIKEQTERIEKHSGTIVRILDGRY